MGRRTGLEAGAMGGRTTETEGTKRVGYSVGNRDGKAHTDKKKKEKRRGKSRYLVVPLKSRCCCCDCVPVVFVTNCWLCCSR